MSSHDCDPHSPLDQDDHPKSSPRYSRTSSSIPKPSYTPASYSRPSNSSSYQPRPSYQSGSSSSAPVQLTRNLKDIKDYDERTAWEYFMKSVNVNHDLLYHLNRRFRKGEDKVNKLETQVLDLSNRPPQDEALANCPLALGPPPPVTQADIDEARNLAIENDKKAKLEIATLRSELDALKDLVTLHFIDTEKNTKHLRSTRRYCTQLNRHRRKLQDRLETNENLTASFIKSSQKRQSSSKTSHQKRQKLKAEKSPRPNDETPQDPKNDSSDSDLSDMESLTSGSSSDSSENSASDTTTRITQ